MNTSLFKQYADLKKQMKALEEVKELLNKEIMEDLKKNGLTKIENEIGKFTVANKTSYSYSEKVMTMQEKLKLAMHKEVEKGIAEPSITNYLLYTAPKESGLSGNII